MPPSFSRFKDEFDEEAPSISRKRKIAAVICSMFAQPTDPFTKYMVLGRNRNADRVNGRNHALAKIMAMSQNNPKYFKTMYRLHVNDFWDLYQKIKADIAKKTPPISQFREY